IGGLEILSECEREQLLIEFNNTAADYPKDTCIHQLFEEQVISTPAAIAVMDEDHLLTYAELDRRANQLAHYLQALGVGPEVPVGILMERSVELVIGIMGILKAGGFYVPLDPVYPRERLAFMVADTQMPVLLTNQHLADDLPSTVQIVSLDTDWPVIAQRSGERPVSGVMVNNLAYVIYTSGSTGKPKGIMVSHQGLVNYLSWCTHHYAVAAGTGSVVHSSIAFDLTITSLFPPLLVGRRVLLVPEERGVEALASTLQQGEDVSLIKITPAHLEMLNQHLSTDAIAPVVGALIIGGEALLGENLTFWRTQAPSTRLINEYGPTETVVGCCIYEVPGKGIVSGNIPIG